MVFLVACTRLYNPLCRSVRHFKVISSHSKFLSPTNSFCRWLWGRPDRVVCMFVVCLFVVWWLSWSVVTWSWFRSCKTSRGTSSLSKPPKKNAFARSEMQVKLVIGRVSPLTPYLIPYPLPHTPSNFWFCSSVLHQSFSWHNLLVVDVAFFVFGLWGAI